jgi:hypothetical protein
MRKLLAVLLLILAGIQSVRAQRAAGTTPQTVEPVCFCDLMRRPDQYEGKKVKVRRRTSLISKAPVFSTKTARNPSRYLKSWRMQRSHTTLSPPIN